MNTRKKRQPGSTASYIRKFYDGDNGFTRDQYDDLLAMPLECIASVFSKLGMAASGIIKARPIRDWGNWRNLSQEPVVDDLNKRLRWELIRLQSNAENLSSQLGRRAEIENYIFDESLAIAQTELTSFESNYGVSLWTLSTRFRLVQIESGSDFNRTELMQFIESGPKKKKNGGQIS